MRLEHGERRKESTAEGERAADRKARRTAGTANDTRAGRANRGGSRLSSTRTSVLDGGRGRSTADVLL
jgi:hypothetical protein